MPSIPGRSGSRSRRTSRKWKSTIRPQSSAATGSVGRLTGMIGSHQQAGDPERDQRRAIDRDEADSASAPGACRTPAAGCPGGRRRAGPPSAAGRPAPHGRSELLTESPGRTLSPTPNGRRRQMLDVLLGGVPRAVPAGRGRGPGPERPVRGAQGQRPLGVDVRDRRPRQGDRPEHVDQRDAGVVHLDSGVPERRPGQGAARPIHQPYRSTPPRPSSTASAIRPMPAMAPIDGRQHPARSRFGTRSPSRIVALPVLCGG